MTKPIYEKTEPASSEPSRCCDNGVFGVPHDCCKSKPTAAPTGTPRCKVTGNPCGTDTWVIGEECTCESCQAYVKARYGLAPIGTGEGSERQVSVPAGGTVVSSKDSQLAEAQRQIKRITEISIAVAKGGQERIEAAERDLTTAQARIANLEQAANLLIDYCIDHDWGQMPEPHDSINPLLTLLERHL